jgi:hypothetical protein
MFPTGLIASTGSLVLFTLILIDEYSHDNTDISMDTATYAAAAALPWSVVQSTEHPIGSEADLLPLDLSYITRSWTRLFRATGPCNDL